MKLDSTIPQWIITLTFLHGLPSSYDLFVEITLNSRSKDADGKLLEPEFNDLCDKVLDSGWTQKGIAADTTGTKALKAATVTYSDQSRGKKRTKCKACERLHSRRLLLSPS